MKGLLVEFSQSREAKRFTWLPVGEPGQSWSTSFHRNETTLDYRVLQRGQFWTLAARRKLSPGWFDSADFSTLYSFIARLTHGDKLGEKQPGSSGVVRRCETTSGKTRTPRIRDFLDFWTLTKMKDYCTVTGAKMHEVRKNCVCKTSEYDQFYKFSKSKR